MPKKHALLNEQQQMYATVSVYSLHRQQLKRILKKLTMNWLLWFCFFLGDLLNDSSALLRKQNPLKVLMNYAINMNILLSSINLWP